VPVLSPPGRRDVLKFGENVQKLSEVLFRFESERPFTVARGIQQGGCDLADFVDL